MRRKNDFYPTDTKLTESLLKLVPLIARSNLILEPCAGDGAIVEVIKKWSRAKIVGYDINPGDSGFFIDDTSEPLFWENLESSWGRLPDWVITNPPFNLASEIIPQAFKASRIGIAMLLRLSYLEPAKNRSEWLCSHSQYMSNLIIFGQPRPSFTGDGKVDTATTAWMVWRKDWHDSCQVNFVTNWMK